MDRTFTSLKNSVFEGIQISEAVDRTSDAARQSSLKNAALSYETISSETGNKGNQCYIHRNDLE